MAKTYHTRKWSPIADLPENWKDLANPELRVLADVWDIEQDELRSTKKFQEFSERLLRQWAIETGVIENLYSLSEGATNTLIEKGLDAALIGHGDSNQPAEYVTALVRDQKQAVDGIYDFVSTRRSLSSSYLKTLHQVLTAHQTHSAGVDSLGIRREVPLLRGAWKKLPNNPHFEDGSRFEYCPPEQVDSEIEQLLKWHQRHESEGVLPEVEAAWLHHRFALIHPFQDGNGRMARCLATMVFLKSRLLPLVVTRTDKGDYIDALRRADEGDLSFLVGLFAFLERKAIRQAFRESDAMDYVPTSVTQAIESAVTSRAQAMSPFSVDEAAVIALADRLLDHARDELQTHASDFNAKFAEQAMPDRALVMDAGPNIDRSNDKRAQTWRFADEMHYIPNLDVYASWIELILYDGLHTSILFSFHGMGKSRRGLLACGAMISEYENQEGASADLHQDRRTAVLFSHVVPLCPEPFEFSFREDSGHVLDRFKPWFEKALLRGIEYWRRRA